MKTHTQKINFISSCFDKEYKISKSGKNISVECPNCGIGTDKKKLSICLDTWIYHCWVCSIKGKTPYKLIKDHISEDLAKVFLKEFGEEQSNEENTNESGNYVNFPSKFNMLASVNKNIIDPDIRDCLIYLKKRGVTEEQLWKHKIGYFSSNSLSRRVVFPSFDNNQKLNFYVTRAIDDNAFIKYRNSNAKKTEIIFDEIRLDWNKELIIVEGVFDMIKCPDNTTCLLGSSLNKEHALFQKIIKNKTPILLGLDSDMKQKTFKIAKILSSYDIQVRIFQHEGSKDIGDLDKELVRQKCIEAPIYSSESRLLHMIDTIYSGSLF